MFVPVLVLFLAILSAGIVAYGTHSAWAQFPHGVDFIVACRQYQWPLAALSLVLCVTVISLVAVGRRRAWWLIGLAPVLALFAHRYYSDPFHRFAILDSPEFVAADQARVGDSDYVVGLIFNGNAYAYPYAALYPAPVVFQTDHDKRMALFWSALANRAVACELKRELHARDLEIVAMPANALLLYNSRRGQFINAVTARTADGQVPAGFSDRLVTWKMPWQQWRNLHPATRVLAPVASTLPGPMPTRPLRPSYPTSRSVPPPGPETPIVMIAATQPVCLPAERIPTRPNNISAGGRAMLIWRDPETGRIRAFDRQVDTDLVPRFKPNTNQRRPVFMIDMDTNSGWDIEGRAIDGPMAQKKAMLRQLPIDEGLWWGVMKTWYPQLLLVEPGAGR